MWHIYETVQSLCTVSCHWWRNVYTPRHKLGVVWMENSKKQNVFFYIIQSVAWRLPSSHFSAGNRCGDAGWVSVSFKYTDCFCPHSTLSSNIFMSVHTSPSPSSNAEGNVWSLVLSCVASTDIQNGIGQTWRMTSKLCYAFAHPKITAKELWMKSWRRCEKWGPFCKCITLSLLPPWLLLWTPVSITPIFPTLQSITTYSTSLHTLHTVSDCKYCK